jgi:hypothetical protein
MEGTASPTDEMFVIFVCRIEDDLQELLVAGHAAHILRWATACTTETNGGLYDTVHRDYLLQHDFMPPVVSEIVLVDHRVAFSVKHVAQRNAAVVNHVVFFVFVQLNDAPVFTVLLELVKVAVRPAHYHLKGAVKAAQLEGTGHLDHTPDRWLNADERDFQSIDGWRCLLRGHRNIVPGFLDPAAVRLVESPSPGMLRGPPGCYGCVVRLPVRRGGRSGGGLVRADAGFVCQSPFPATDCGQRWLLAPSPVSDHVLRRSKRSTETEQDSAAPPQVALQSIVYRFVGPVKKQQRPSDPIDEQSSAEEDGEDRHRQSSIRSSRQ